MKDETEKKADVKWYNTTTVKMGVVAFMVLLLMAPLAMIGNMIDEREQLSESVQRDIAEQWGREQLILGPILSIPVTVSNSSVTNKVDTRWLHFMPEDLKVKGTMNAETRKRGIYKSVLYTSKLRIEGSFATSGLNTDNLSDISWKDAVLAIGISDMRGIRGKVNVIVDSIPVKASPGLASRDFDMAGISAKMPESITLETGRHKFTIEIELAGSEKISFIPVGQTTDIMLSSPWKNPAFVGSYLPQKRKVDEKGFEASWNVTYLNRDIPEQWIGKISNIKNQQLGVEFFLPVNHYQKSMRSAKYGILFIVLTLLVLIYFELTGKSKIHLFQYFLVGLALVLFFSVLTALSEQVGFNIAYVIASLAIIALITAYTYAVLANKKNAVTVAILLTALYAFLYILLQLNEYAFLAGNIGLFIILGIVMKGSLKIKQEE